MNIINFRRANLNDLPNIMEIIRQAQVYLRSLKIDQWQNNYPNKEVVEEDIKNNNSYVLTYNSKVVAVAAIIFDIEPTYGQIHDGEWLSSSDYVTIHRIAVSNEYKNLGLGKIIINKTKKLALERGVFSLRIDTHQDNLVMQKFILSNKFTYCGIIYLSDNSKRLAYEKLV